MEERPVVRYVWFGTCLRFLQDVQPGYPLRGSGHIIANIEAFFRYVEELDLTVTQRTDGYDELWSLLAELQEADAEGEEDEPRITADQARRLKGTMDDIRKTLMAEAGGNIAFVTTEKRIDVPKLLADIPALVTREAYDKLDEIAQHDLEEAGKCIAFERPTAAAFHLLRGTESVLRAFYCSVVKRNRIDPMLWDGMVKGLQGRQKPPPEPLLANLTNIRRSFRNPTQHPEKTYDIEEAQDLFGLCVDVIRRMTALM